MTVYQIQGPRQNPWTQSQFLKSLDNTLGNNGRGQETPAWWPFEKYEICRDAAGSPITLTTPYFDHYPRANLAAGQPWKYLDLQGNNDTVYVHASTCFSPFCNAGNMAECYWSGQSLA